MRERARDWWSGRSLRWRVAVTAILVMTVALVVIGVAVNLTLNYSLRRDQQSRLDDRATRATLLVQAGTSTSDLLPQVDGQGIQAVVLDSAGRRLTPFLTPADRTGPGRDPAEPEPDPDAAPGTPPPGTLPGTALPGPDPATGRGPVAAALRLRTVREIGLNDGSRLVLVADPGENSTVLGELRTVTVVVGALGLAVTAIALLASTRVALRPLDAMTALARSITAGDRGRRLRPRRADTELGRTAQAFDEMLDALDAAQAEAERAAEEARRSEATTRRFLSDAAHELRTPLASVQSLAESMVRRPDADLERRERVATTLVRETRRAGALVADMLELARVEGGPRLEPRAVELGDLAAAEGERAALLAPSLHVTSTGEPVTVTADPARVTQILANLLENARRHSPEGGTIRLETRAVNGTGTVDVADEGPGVPEEERERVFDRLVRLDDARTRDAGGAGLGLPIARALARAHGGDLAYVDDGASAGARFRLTLPRA